MTVEEVTQRAASPFELGNVVVAVRGLVEAIERGTVAERHVLYAELGARLGARRSRLTEAERRWCLARLAELTETARLAAARDALCRLLAESSSRVEPVPVGRLNVVCVAEPRGDERRFGFVCPLDISVERTGKGPRLLHDADEQALFQGFEQGVAAAESYVLRHGLGTGLFGPRLTQAYTYTGALEGLPWKLPVRGPSLGLGAAVGVISGMAEIPVAPDLAFTGRLDTAGQVHGVGGIDLKVEAAAHKGMKVVFVPSANAADVPLSPTIAPRVEVVSSLDQVVQRVFDPEELRRGLDRLRSLAEPIATIGSRGPVADLEPREDELPVLLTCVGRSDPIGRPLDQERRAVERLQEEGPVLTLWRVLRPRFVFVLHTTGPDRENDYSGKAQAIKELLEAADPDCRVNLRPLSSVSDPTDYSELVPAMRDEVLRIVRDLAGRRVRYFVNMSSGTAQMETAWHALTAWRDLEDPRLLQVRESRWLRQEGESRMRKVSPTDILPGASG